MGRLPVGSGCVSHSGSQLDVLNLRSWSVSMMIESVGEQRPVE